MNISESLIDEVKSKCYITDTDEITTTKVTNLIKRAMPKVKRMIGINDDYFNFEAKDNQEELDLFLNYCWYDWNDSSNEFKDNYLNDINSIRHKHEVAHYAEKENIQL